MVDLNKKLIVFDLDSTLAESKLPIDSEMKNLIAGLLRKKEVAVIGGGSWEKFNEQILSPLDGGAELGNLYLFPTNAAAFYKYDGGKWKLVYRENLSSGEKEKIEKSINKSLIDAGFKKPGKLYGEEIEDRGTEITFSALGQKAPLSEKETWDPDHKKRELIANYLEKYLPEFSVKIAGTTSIDVTRKGVDKAYGIKQMEKYLGVPKTDMLYVGDSTFPGGNDYPAKETGVETLQVSGPGETKKIIGKIIEENMEKVA